MASASNDASVDIENLETSLRGEFGRVNHLLTEECCIYRVPERLRKSYEAFYTPRIVSIGPLHHGREELKEMEEFKRKCLEDLLKRTKISLAAFIEVVKINEAKLRNSYSETIELNNHDFFKMIIVDAAFIIEVLLWSFWGEVSIDKRAYIKPRLKTDVLHDMTLLENQLPFFILEDLFSLATSSEEDNQGLSMLTLTHEFSSNYWDLSPVKNLNNYNHSMVRHFVDFLRIRYLPSDLGKKRRSAYRTAPSVTEIHQSGVKFKLSSSSNLLDISFNSGIMEIPKIKIGTGMESLLRNLWAFEQCHCLDIYLNDYVVLMDSLLRSSKDVDLLIQNGIIENWLRDSEGVSVLCHSLVEQTVFDDVNYYYFSSLVEDLNRYCEAPWHKWMATLKQDYFNTPWSSISVVAAVVLLFLTLVQSICSILQVK